MNKKSQFVLCLIGVKDSQSDLEKHYKTFLRFILQTGI